MVWAGVNPRREVEIESTYEESTFAESLLGIAIRHGTASELKSLHPDRNDLPLIRQALLRPSELDKQKLDMLLACGLELGDREDGTSSFLYSAVVRQDCKAAFLLAKAGARLPRLTRKEVHSFNSALCHHSSDKLSEEEFGFLLDLIASQP
jgi:hypothetical protein